MGKQILKLLPVVLSLILQGGTVAEPAQETVQIYPEVQSSLSTQDNQDQIQVYMHQTGETVTLSIEGEDEDVCAPAIEEFFKANF